MTGQSQHRQISLFVAVTLALVATMTAEASSSSSRHYRYSAQLPSSGGSASSDDAFQDWASILESLDDEYDTEEEERVLSALAQLTEGGGETTSGAASPATSRILDATTTTTTTDNEEQESIPSSLSRSQIKRRKRSGSSPKAATQGQQSMTEAQESPRISLPSQDTKRPENASVKGYHRTSGQTSVRLTSYSQSPVPGSAGIGSTMASSGRTQQRTQEAAASVRQVSRTVVSSLPPAPQTAHPSLTVTPWTRNFVASHPRDALLLVPKDYLSDGFNLAQLPPILERIAMELLVQGAPDASDQQTLESLLHPLTSTAVNEAGKPLSYPIYRHALQRILQDDPSGIDVAARHPLLNAVVQETAEILYCMVHSRYVTSPRGLETITRILQHHPSYFGQCPNRSCHGHGLLPYGSNWNYHRGNNAQRYCPCCGQVWNWFLSDIPECAWGPSVASLWLLVGQRPAVWAPSSPQAPRVFGFPLHSSAIA